MTIVVTPDNDRNTHHIKLSDGVTDIGLILSDRRGNADPRGFQRVPIPRSSVKIYAGEQRHSDLLPPWDDRSFNDWTGGMGGEKLEDDTTRYYDGAGIDTTRGGQFILGPLHAYATGIRTEYSYNWPLPYFSTDKWYAPEYKWHNLDGSPRAVAVKFTLTTIGTPPTDSTPEVTLIMKVTGAPTGGWIYIYTDSSSSPGSLVTGLQVNIPSSLGKTAQEIVVQPGYGGTTLTTATTYWLVVDGGTSVDASNYYSVLASDIVNGTPKVSNNLSSWSTMGVGEPRTPFFRVTNITTSKQFGAHFAEMKGALFAALEYYDGTTSKVYVDGLAGKATAGAAGYVRDSNNSAVIVNDRYNSGIVKLTSGTGSQVPSPWRAILDTTTTNSEIDVYPSWDATPDTTSEYALLGTNYWNEVTGHSLSAGQFFADALGVNGAIYLTRGDGVAMKRLREYWASSTYWQWTDESGIGTFLEKIVYPSSTDVWLAKRAAPAQIQRAAGMDCTGTATVASLSFGTAINVGDLGEKITNLMVAGESFPLLHVFKEGSIHQVIYDAPNEMRIAGLRNTADERNGAAACVADVYLYFSYLDSLERYYRGQIDDIGPARNGSLPAARRGRICSVVAYPGKLIVAVDGGTGMSKYSSILAYNGSGWCELWRSPTLAISGTAARRILGDMWIQSIPGQSADRLWWSYGGDLLWMPLAIDPYRHNDTDGSHQFYQFRAGGEIETSWFHFGMEEIDKLFNKVTVTGEGWGSDGSLAAAFLDYKLDDDTTYTTVGQFTMTNNVGSLDLSATHNVTGKRIMLRVRLETYYSNRTPRITAITIEGLVTVPHKYETALTFTVEDYAYTLLPDLRDDITDADTKLSQLSTWASAAGTVAMSGHLTQLDGKRVKIDAPSLQVLEHTVGEIDGRKANKFICQMNLIEVD